MGSLFCHKMSDQDRENWRIEQELKRYRDEQRKVYRILLLGTGGCGKSTFLKQMKVIENEEGNIGEPFPLQERIDKWRTLVFFNVYSGIKVLLRQMKILGIEYGSAENERRGNEILDIDQYINFVSPDGASIRLDYAMKVKELWEDAGVQKCFERRAEYQLEDSVQFFLDHLDEVMQEDYVPSVKHVLHVRVKTTTIYTQDIPLRDNTTLRMIDVGGQRCYREKWIHYFDNAVTVIFITSLSEFDLKLEEDQSVSRTNESLSLFQRIVENQFFINTCIILFLNKKDLMRKKLKKVDFTDYFEDYDPDDFEHSDDHPKEAEFMRELYMERVKDSIGDDRTIYSYITCATDKENVKIIWDVVRTTILENAMRVIALN